MRTQELKSGDLWVVIPGLDRHQSAAAVGAALPEGDLERRHWKVLPTLGGTYVRLFHGSQWRTVAETLKRTLTARGVEGWITAPDNVATRIWPFVEALLPLPPAALAAYRMDPPVEAGPINPWGQPDFRWGLPEAQTADLLSNVVDWVWAAPDATGMMFGGGISMPASREDAADLKTSRLAEGQCVTQLSAISTSPDRVRQVEFDRWGGVGYCDVHASRDQVSMALDLVPILTRDAAALDVGAICLVHWNGARWGLRRNGGLWMLNRHLWSSRVHDANGIQLLTTDHLNNAHDLSGWDVSEVAPDRYLVQAKDLSPWYACDTPEEIWQERFPSDEVLDQARSDLGEMILTHAIAAANPIVAPPRM